MTSEAKKGVFHCAMNNLCSSSPFLHLVPVNTTTIRNSCNHLKSTSIHASIQILSFLQGGTDARAVELVPRLLRTRLPRAPLI
jgi:hypothetical protein